MSNRRDLERLWSDVGDLVARHDDARGLDEYGGYADDPVGFFREVLGAEPWSRQVEIAEAVRDHRRVVVRSANGVGKDWTAARLALWWAVARRGLALITGPTERQVREVVMGEVARAFRGAPGKDLPGELYASALRLGRDEYAGIRAFTSTEASKLTGFHPPRGMAILTEAQGVEDFAWEGMRACVTGDEDRTLAVGNPLAPEGPFFRVSRSPSWESIQIPASDHPNVVEDRTVIPGGPSRSWIESSRREWGRNDPRTMARIEGEFPESAEDSLIQAPWLDASVERWKNSRPTGDPLQDRTLLSVDPAGYGPDETAVVVLEGMRVREIRTWAKHSTMETAGRVIQVVGELNLEFEKTWISVDLPGMGHGPADRLEERGGKVFRFNGAEKAVASDQHANRRAEAYFRTARLLEEEILDLPSDSELRQELLAIRWTVDSSGRISIPRKETIRSRLGRSPDRADALVNAVWLRMELNRMAALMPDPDQPEVFDPEDSGAMFGGFDGEVLGSFL